MTPQRPFPYTLIAIAIALGGCQIETPSDTSVEQSPSPAPSALFTGPSTSELPACVTSDCNCSDFTTQPEAQQVLEAFEGDRFRLDGDGNGRACESLPGAAPVVPDIDAPVATGEHLLFGNPSTASVTNPDNYLLQRPEYVLSYNASRGTANWASWHLSDEWLGPVERQDDFRPDPLLPSGIYAVRPNDYRGSGYDRGHLVPSGDRTAAEAMNSATFVMSNIIPQTPENNREAWRLLEEFSRRLVGRGRELYVIAGVYGEQKRIADDEVVVPTNVWKVAVVLPQGAGLEAMTAETPVIAVDIPNSENLQGWGSYLTTVDVIEEATGYDLLSNLPQNIQAEIEARKFKGL